MADRNNREVTFEIHEHVAVLSEVINQQGRRFSIVCFFLTEIYDNHMMFVKPDIFLYPVHADRFNL